MSDSDVVTVVTGVPRSGTSLVMQMLAAGGLPLLTDGVRPADADNPRGYCEYEPVRSLARDAGWVGEARGRAVKVIHALVSHLPPEHRYRVLLVTRPWKEVIASQDAMLARRGQAGGGIPAERLAEIYAAQIDELAAWAEARPAVSLERLEHRDILDDPAAAARRLDVFLGGGLDRDAMASVVDRSLYRQRPAEA